VASLHRNVSQGRYARLTHAVSFSDVYARIAHCSDSPVVESKGINCPNCDTYNVLLPSSTYTGQEAVDPGDLKDENLRQDSVFAIVTTDGDYICGNPDCRQQLEG
jgi:hypothetical protein